MAPAVATYEPRDPSRTVLYKVVADHLETFLAALDADPDATGLPAYVQREFYDYLQCGILAHGFLRLGCDTCQQELLLPFSCKRRGFCPSCAGRRMAQTAAHLVECVIPWVPTRQWVVSVPVPLRYWMYSSQALTAQMHTIIRTTISQYYVNQAVKRGVERQQVQAGSVTFIQRFGGALNLNVHFGTFRIPVDSFQETSGGSRMLIRISNLYDSSTSTTNQRQRNEVYQTPRFRAPDAYPYRHARVAASRCLRQNDGNRKSLSNIQDLP